MSTYIFILGKHRNLSFAELFASFPDAEIETLGNDFVVLKTGDSIDQKRLDTLGGVLKIAEVIQKTNFSNLNQILSAKIADGFTGRKLEYGLSIYGRSQRDLKGILIDLKKTLIKSGVKSRFINKDFKNISTAQYKSIKDKGAEYIISDSGSGVYLGKVVAVQDIDAYSKRDYEKPFRNMKVGMLPPKLAQIMINLTGTKGTIWDPFCGGGVLLMEGLLMGHDMIGSDLDADALEGAKKNVAWLKSDKKAKLFVHDATKPVPPIACDAIATESYLGPPQTQPLTESEAKNQIEHLSRLYIGFFEALKKTGFNKVVVIALPYFKLKNKRELDLRDVIEKIKSLGFEQLPFLPEMTGIRDRHTLKYSRPDQYVGRAIYKFIAT